MHYLYANCSLWVCTLAALSVYDSVSREYVITGQVSPRTSTWGCSNLLEAVKLNQPVLKMHHHSVHAMWKRLDFISRLSNINASGFGIVKNCQAGNQCKMSIVGNLGTPKYQYLTILEWGSTIYYPANYTFNKNLNAENDTAGVYFKILVLLQFMKGAS